MNVRHLCHFPLDWDFIEKHQHFKTTMELHWHVFTLLQHVRFTWHLTNDTYKRTSAHIFTFTHISWPKTTKIETQNNHSTRNFSQKWIDKSGARWKTKGSDTKMGHWRSARNYITNVFFLPFFCFFFLLLISLAHQLIVLLMMVILNLLKLLLLLLFSKKALTR